MIFRPIGKKDYECLNAVNKDDYNVLASLDGTPRKTTWKPIVVRCVRADKRQKQLVSDFPWLGRVLYFRERAAEVLKDMLEENGEMLPIITEDGVNLYVHNTFVLPNVLDEEKTSFWRVEGIDRILGVKRPVFYEKVIRGIDMFRLPFRSSATYVSDRFVELVAKNNLKGLEFNPV
ncbi:MAG: hypothetical protein LBK61_00900 [Spirochaetaceae bacterium]|jgi:hypothetical protein|nr:hypothetical protein [Spirochaetaceae bacterium]